MIKYNCIFSLVIPLVLRAFNLIQLDPNSTRQTQNSANSKESERNTRNHLYSFAYNFIGGVLVLSFVGYKLDEYFENSNHLFLLIGIFLGLIWSMYETYKLTKLINKDKN